MARVKAAQRRRRREALTRATASAESILERRARDGRRLSLYRQTWHPNTPRLVCQDEPRRTRDSCRSGCFCGLLGPHQEEPKPVHPQDRPEATLIRTSRASAISRDEQGGRVDLVIRIEQGSSTDSKRLSREHHARHRPRSCGAAEPVPRVHARNQCYASRDGEMPSR